MHLRSLFCFFDSQLSAVICECANEARKKRPSGRPSRAGYRSYVTSLIHDWSRSHLTYLPGGCRRVVNQSGSGFSSPVGFGPGSALDFETLSGFNRAWRRSKIEVFSE